MEKRKANKKTILWVIAGTIIVIAAIGGIVGGTATNNKDNAQLVNAGTSAEDLEVLEHSVIEDSYPHIVGKVRNNTDKTYSYVQVSINLYKDDVQLGSTLANINNLEPNSIWEFDALVTYEDFTSYKIVEVTGF